MYCFQCQEVSKNTACTSRGVCGKSSETADLQDLLIWSLKGIAVLSREQGETALRTEAAKHAARSLFTTITNANFNSAAIQQYIGESLRLRSKLLEGDCDVETPFSRWNDPEEQWQQKATEVGILAEDNEDIRSLKETILYGMKGIAAYAVHALNLGYEDQEIWTFLLDALATLSEDHSAEELIQLVLDTGKAAVTTMALLDKANTESFGNPEISKVSIGVGTKPGILISGHDLKDMEALLEQTMGSGVDVYTHSEMLPANYYPKFKKYPHFVGNYGNAWWQQDREFASFNGPILMTTNCIVPVRESYKDRIFTTGQAGYPGIPHIPESREGQPKDFSTIIELAKTCKAPTEIENGEIVGGFAHAQVLALKDKVVEAVKSGKIRRFIVMAGCDGRQKGRSYFTDLAKTLPDDTVILTAGCAKYRYNKLGLGDIGGIPRVLDAGQCNDSYSLALIALKLQEIFELSDINDLPISFDIAWYEQKAVAVLLALLFLGVKGIRLGPTLPAFLSPGVAKVLTENFGIKGIAEVEEDIEAMLKGA